MRKILAALMVTALVALAPIRASALLSIETTGDRSFHATCTITSAAAATLVHCVSQNYVPANAVAYLHGFIATVNGGTAWATTANCFLKDTAASPVTLATIAVSALTGNAVVNPYTSGVTLASPVLLGTGATEGAGVDLVCNANGTGSNLVVTVYGTLKRVGPIPSH